MKIKIGVTGMGCNGCVKAVEEACMSIDGVKKAKASLKKNNVEIHLKDDSIIENIKAAIVAAGYGVTEN